MSPESIRFISEPIAVEFDVSPALEKKPHCPDRFVWSGKTYAVVDLVQEWVDVTRRGRMEHNMRPDHLSTARRKGSWGVGRHHFRVRTDAGPVFDIYYDRAPRSNADRKGSWVLYREVLQAEQ